MARTTYPQRGLTQAVPNGEGPVPQQDDPLAALSTFLSGTKPATSYDTPANRTEYDFGDGRTGSFAGLSRDTQATPYEQNQASEASAADASDAEHLKQANLLNAFFNPQAEQQRSEEQAGKVALAQAPAEATGRAAIATQREKGAGDLAVQQSKNEGNIAVAKAKASSTMMDPTQVDWLAQQAMRDFNGTMSKVPNAMRPQVLARLSQLDANPSSPTNQQKQMSEASNDILDTIDRNDFVGQAQNLHQKGLFAPGVGAIRRFAAEHGAGTLLGVDNDTASQMGQFETTHGLLLSMIQRAHAGARGAGNSEMAARFEKLLADQGDMPTFLGELKGMRGLLEQYASHTNPTRGFSTGISESDDLGPAWGK